MYNLKEVIVLSLLKEILLSLLSDSLGNETILSLNEINILFWYLLYT